MGIFRQLFGFGRGKYRLDALVSSRMIEPGVASSLKNHIICDLDKTYVETEFESWVKMARIPFERPHEKITVSGANEILQEVRWARLPNQPSSQPRSALHFVSSSPPQLRSALEGKLVLDSLDWTSDTFKNQTYNIRMARMDLLRHHIAYKTKAILDIIQVIPESGKIWLIGDNAEYDPYVYSGIKLFVEGSIDVDGLKSWLASAHVEPDVVAQVIENADLVQRKKIQVAGVFIRKLANYPIVQQPPVSDFIIMFESWFQVGWEWILSGLIPSSSIWRIIRCFHNLHGLSLAHVSWGIDQLLESPRTDLKIDIGILADIKVRLEYLQIQPRKCYEWNLFPLSTMAAQPIQPPSLNSAVPFAKKWYQNIENARSVRTK